MATDVRYTVELVVKYFDADDATSTFNASCVDHVAAAINDSLDVESLAELTTHDLFDFCRPFQLDDVFVAQHAVDPGQNAVSTDGGGWAIQKNE